MRELKGDIIILGAGGKTRPSLAALIRRAADETCVATQVAAVSRFGSNGSRHELEAMRVNTISVGLLNPMMCHGCRNAKTFFI
jgi:hypothetical protein